MNRKRLGAGLWPLACLGALLTSTTALAGRTSEIVLVVDDNFRFAHGTLGSAHNSSDSVQKIGCRSNSDVGTCFAQNAASVYRECTTSNRVFLNIIRSLKSDSRLRFSWDAMGRCTEIVHEISSVYAPKR